MDISLHTRYILKIINGIYHLEFSMDIFKDDLFKYKYFRLAFIILVVGIAIYWFLDYTSVESRCTRYIQGLGSLLGTGGNGMREAALDAASQPLIEECIQRGGP